jgi:hypothetical protein
MNTLLQELTENNVSYIGWRRTKLSGWCKTISTFEMDIFVFFHHPHRTIFAFRKASMSFPFPAMETPIHFEIFRWDYITQGWKFPTVSKFSDQITFSNDASSRLFRNFLMILHYPKMEISDSFEVFRSDYLF